MQNHYLEVLGLTPGATKAEIKSAYRQLSKVYHPDVSKDDKAKEKFIAINEAYKFLTDVGPRPETIRSSAPAYDYDIQNRAYDEWRRRARAYARKKAEDEARRQQELTKVFLRTFESIGVILAIINLVIVIDLILPNVRSEGEVMSSSIFIEEHHSLYETLQVDQYEFKFKKKHLNFLKMNPKYGRVVVYSTPILDQPVSVEIDVSWKTYALKQYAGLYGFFCFIPFLLLVVWCLYKYVCATLDAQLSIAVLYIFLVFFEIIIYLLSIR